MLTKLWRLRRTMHAIRYSSSSNTLSGTLNCSQRFFNSMTEGTLSTTTRSCPFQLAKKYSAHFLCQIKTAFNPITSTPIWKWQTNFHNIIYTEAFWSLSMFSSRNVGKYSSYGQSPIGSPDIIHISWNPIPSSSLGVKKVLEDRVYNSSKVKNCAGLLLISYW